MAKKIYAHYQKHKRKFHIGFGTLLTLGIILSGTYMLYHFKIVQAASPVITSVTNIPDPVSVGQSITFSVSWIDPDPGSSARIDICKTAGGLDIWGNCVGGAWCVNNTWRTTPSTCLYTAQIGDIGARAYTAYVTDNTGLIGQYLTQSFNVSKQLDGQACTFGDQCVSDLCIDGVCRAAGSCPSYQAKGCSTDTNTYDDANAGTCTNASCDYIGEVRYDNDTNTAYDTCNFTSGDACDSDAGGHFSQTAKCSLDGCIGLGICYAGSSYRSQCSLCYNVGSTQSFCDFGGFGDYLADGICVNDGSCAYIDVYYNNDLPTPTFYGSVSSYPELYQHDNDNQGDSCDSDVDGGGYVRDGMTVFSGGSLTPNCDAFGGAVRIDSSNRFVADCDSSLQMCDSSTANSYDPFQDNGFCVQNTCDINEVAKDCNYAEADCSNYYTDCSIAPVQNNDRCYTGYIVGIPYSDNGVCVAGNCIAKASESGLCSDGIDNDGNGYCDLGGCLGVPSSDIACTGGPIPLISSVSSVSQDTGRLDIVVNANGNPTSAQYALYNYTESKYVNGTTGALQTSEDWQVNKLSWTNIGLTPPAKPFTYQVKARVLGIESELSSDNATYSTYAAVPGAPSVSNLVSGDQKIVINKNGNYDGVPGGAEYRIEVTSVAFPGITKYVPVGGGSLIDLTDPAPKWATYQGWGGSSGVVVLNLINGQTYSYKLKARNTYQEETTTLSPPTALQAGIVTGGTGGFTRQLSIIKEVTNPANGILTAAEQTVTFRVTVRNSGIDPTSLEYTITDILPPGFTFLGNITAKNPSGMVVSGACNTGNLTCDEGGIFSDNGRTLKWTLNEVINQGSQVSFKYEAKAP